MLKICFILSNISNCGGTERVCTQIATVLSNHNEVSILSFAKGKSYFQCGSQVRVFHLVRKFEQLFLFRHPKLLIAKLKFFFLFHRFDIVIDTFLNNANITIPAIHGLNIRHLVWSNFSYEYFRRVPHEQVALEKVKLNKSHLLVLTKGDMQQFLEKENFGAERIHQIYNPLPVVLPHVTEHLEKKVIAVGRFALEKGFDKLLEAWHIVEKFDNEWNLEIWGDVGYDTGNVHSTFNKLKLKRAQLFPATKDIYQHFGEASIYAMSSMHEGFPLVLLEAQSFSLPIVSFDCPNGPREIVTNDYDGKLVPLNDINELANALLYLMKNRNVRCLYGSRAFESAKRFNIDSIMSQWEKLLNDIIS